MNGERCKVQGWKVKGEKVTSEGVNGESGRMLNAVNGGHDCRKENRKVVSCGVEGARAKGEM